MKIFIGAFIISFTLLLSAYYGIGYYQTLEDERIEGEMAAYARARGPETSSDNFSLPDAKPEPVQPVNESRTRAPRTPWDNDRFKPNIADSSAASYAAAIASPGKVSNPKVAPRSIPPESDVVVDEEALKQLTAMKYEFTRPRFLDAVARDDSEAVSLFLKAGMHTEFNLNYFFEPAKDSIFTFYASESALLFNPLSLAVVAEANKSLPLLIAGTKDLQTANQLTAEQRIGPDRAIYDLLGLAVKTDNLQLLRQFIAAGLKPVSQTYILVALLRSNRKLPPGANAEEKLKLVRKKADMLVELINNGQKVSQRLPIPIPVPSAMEMFFVLAGKTIRGEVIARVTDEKARIELQAMADKIDKRQKN